MANSLVSPLLPDILETFDQSAGSAGPLVAAASLPGIFLAPIIGFAADRAGIEGEPVVERIRPSQVPWWLRSLLSEDAMSRSQVHGIVGLLEALSAFEDDASPVWLWRMPLVTEGLRW